ncbi:MAG: outer membrane beta-barrel protein [Rhodopseudomonas sp.]|nr:outer membrane beta-barrel protein [Rhodopseudomonas sp.]
MRISVALVTSVGLSIANAAWAQTPGERTPPPEATQGWTPTTPKTAETTDQKIATDPWQQFKPIAPGLHYGAMTVYPSVTAGAFYDDNVFASSSNRQGSWGGFVRPELGLTATGSNYTAEARGYVERKWYSKFSSEDQTNGGLGLATTVMPDSNTQLIGKVGYTRAHEDRGGGEALISAFDKPVGYNNWEASGAINKRFGRWWTSLGLAGSWTKYDTPTLNGTGVNQDYRDGRVGVLSGRVGYVVAPLTSVFVEVAGNRRDFEVDTFDSRGYRVVGGVLLEPGQGAWVKGEAFAGYMHQDYDGITFNTISTFTYGGSLAMLLAPRWTGVVEGRRNALESGLNGGVSLIESVGAARLDYALLPNLIVGGGASYLVDEFQGAGRTDRSLSPLVSVKYLMSPNVTLGFDYRNVAFDSAGTGVPSYYRNVFLFSVNGRI